MLHQIILSLVSAAQPSVGSIYSLMSSKTGCEHARPAATICIPPTVPTAKDVVVFEGLFIVQIFHPSRLYVTRCQQR